MADGDPPAANAIRLLPDRPSLHPVSGVPRARRAGGEGERLWRICLPADIWSPPHGEGRWHHAGEPMVYASLSPALAALEALAHRDGADLHQPHRLGTLALPSGPRLVLRQRELGDRWWHDETHTRAFGSAWLASQASLLLFVPSALVPDAYNVLINAAHPGWNPRQLASDVREFRFDPRLC